MKQSSRLGCRRMPKMALTALAVLMTAGCAGFVPPQPASDHPANPRAPQALVRTVPATLTFTAGPAGSMAGASHDHGAGTSDADSPSSSPDALYVCPMHDEVTSAMAGVCPKCGMALVRKTEAAPGEGEHTHEP